eukprot:CAMPEP_0206194814 /NCGR_PEP_ID=MMETSP0166-20121206/7443_1 /ASSEMBLY_ACC=CAM_ASM_000260 /TAXON_ID=95228 /ORGANISM="Vannella robusta, Strain DIVA3 518/3/11/1/6" /LENGTH=46 /DNA_ID= /DNA_START= /DNA_END= /DNA_ORIENTATION=
MVHLRCKKCLVSLVEVVVVFENLDRNQNLDKNYALVLECVGSENLR